jgi:hypothetical protein
VFFAVASAGGTGSLVSELLAFGASAGVVAVPVGAALYRHVAVLCGGGRHRFHRKSQANFAQYGLVVLE